MASISMDEAQAIWTAKSDDELLDAARELSEFTEEGERIIRAELQRRGLPEPDPPVGACSRCGRSISPNHPGDECVQCGEPLPPDIIRALGAAAANESEGHLETAKTSAGEPLTVSWEVVRSDGAEFPLLRARVPGGWLVASETSGALTFVPDVEHTWQENA